jgi:hypothetical protein
LLRLACIACLQGAGWRDSWWVELPPEQQPEQPKASLVLMYLHGEQRVFWAAADCSSAQQQQ